MIRTVHFLGGVRTARVRWERGWPCCCSGKRAEAIAADPARSTLRPWAVTCKGCLRTMSAMVMVIDEPGKERGE
jgi:hypothetical protein